MPTEEERLFIDKIEIVVKNAMNNQTSPFSYLQVCGDLFSEKLQLKLIEFLKFMITHSICYQMSPANIFGLCVKWTVNRYGIKNTMIKELIDHLIDPEEPETLAKMG
jgi:hypothetical protein